ncbi:META domain-containing protein [Dyadobacter arcticus]|uniref:Lipocalin-like domain-containing protein n=1 Tax=Dyadobacter arcticus TaxID=1078754 RepID=A0ABX0UHU9_9BACT|nr:META domain-containing protein [Dyadobacter arcticus]NIJ50960.1 hypothetical protein [Dyadobacter arcticus]
MKKVCYYTFILFVGCFAFQCTNEEAARLCCGPPPCSEKNTLTGTWRLTAFENITTGALDADPDPDGRGVVFTLKDDTRAGTIEGHTVANQVYGAYTLISGCTIEIKSFGGSKVGEPKWSGKAWLASSQGTYSVQGETLKITFKNALESMVFKKSK